MRTLRELLGLTRVAGTLWWRHLPPLLGWFSVGYALNELAGHASTLLPEGQRIIGTTLIILGIVAWVACLVLAIRGLEAAGSQDPPIEVLAASMGPFMAVYGAWGLAEEQFDRLIQANLMTHGIDANLFSVDASDWGLFLGFAVAAVVIRLLVRLIGSRYPSRGLVFTGLVADGAWIFASFFVLREFLGRGFDWLTSRELWRWWQTGWDAFVGILPNVPIWYRATLPEGVQLLADRFWGFIVPGFGNAVLLPLMWVALVGTVFGHRDFTADDLIRGTRAEAAAELLHRTRGRPLRRIMDLATSEAQEKYLPMLSTLGLLRATGVRFIGAFLVLVAAVQLAGSLLDRLILFLVGPRPLPDTLLYSGTANYLVAAVTTPTLLACYAAAYLRATQAQGRSSSALGGVDSLTK